MLRKIFVCALMLTVLCLAGCGEEKKSSDADKAVLAYAELLTGGESANMAAAGLTDADKTELRQKFVGNFIDGLKDVVPLTEQSADAIATKYFTKFKSEMKFQATIKTDDPAHPVVELKTTPLDMDAANKGMASNDELIALIGMVGQLKADGATDDQLKNNADVQKLAVAALDKFVDSIALQGEKTFDVTCDEVTGSDGKKHWAPADIEALTAFIMGQK